MDEFYAFYKAKDVILYALAVGFGSDPERSAEGDLRYLYEGQVDPIFEVLPTFCLALTFLADKASGADIGGIPSFPPPLMRSMGVLPRRYLRTDITISTFPVLHTWQSVSFHRKLPIPAGSGSVKTTLRGHFLSVNPKSIGTFVTTETTVDLSNERGLGKTLCTMQSTALVLGVPEDIVIAFDSGMDRHARYKPSDESNPIFETEYVVPPNQALFYRLASGDSNKIHVDASAVPMLDSSRPLLHGLCTIGIVARFILQWTNDNYKHANLKHLEARFRKPVFIGDRICVRVWIVDGGAGCDKHLAFTVRNAATKDVIVDNACAIVECLEDTKRSRL